MRRVRSAPASAPVVPSDAERPSPTINKVTLLTERALAYALSTLRAQQGLTQQQLALAMGASSASYLSKLETGRCDNPSARYIRRYLAAYGLLGHPLSAEQRSAISAVLYALREAA